MAHFTRNHKGFLIIEAPVNEFNQVGLPNACDDCGESINTTSYYVCVTNRHICKKCLTKFVKTNDPSKQSYPTEYKNMLRAVQQIHLRRLWDEKGYPA